VIGWILLGMAFLLRLLWGLWAVGQPAAAVLGDSFWYHETAVRIALGRGYLNPFTELPTAAWPPGYPAALALLYAVAGVDRRLGILLNAAAGTVTCFCCWRLARALAGERAGLAALALLAFFPSHVFFTSLLLSETLFAAALAMLMWSAATMLAREPSPLDDWRWLTWGAGAGLAALIRGEADALGDSCAQIRVHPPPQGDGALLHAARHSIGHAADDVAHHLEVAERAPTFRLNDALGHAFAVEGLHLLDQVVILQQDGSLRPRCVIVAHPVVVRIGRRSTSPGRPLFRKNATRCRRGDRVVRATFGPFAHHK